ncbi:MAG: hypothetical protein ACE5R6_02125 [Candidatus Heimdallarchaeota archaeon]
MIKGESRKSSSDSGVNREAWMKAGISQMPLLASDPWLPTCGPSAMFFQPLTNEALNQARPFFE